MFDLEEVQEESLTSQLIGKLVQQAGECHDAGADHVGRRTHKASHDHLKQHRQAALAHRSIACMGHKVT